MHSVTRLPGRRCAALLLALASAGCVASKYKFAEYERQAEPLNFAAAPPGTGDDTAFHAPGAVLHTVIVPHGPGSWKRHAYWDEYVVSFTNRHGATAGLESVVLIDFQGQPSGPGRDPWKLEQESRDNLSRIAGTAGDVVQIGSGLVVASGTGLAAGSVAAWATGTTGWAAWNVVGAGFVAAIPVYAVGTVYRNVSNRLKIEEEFSRRSLALPREIPPGTTVQGSLFFRVTPGPQRLVFRLCAGDGTTADVTIDLSPLNGLHLKPAPGPG
jgi:hypothetical protein